MSSEVEPPSRHISVTWIGECNCGHRVVQTLSITKEDQPGVWLACDDCARENYLTETEGRHP